MQPSNLDYISELEEINFMSPKMLLLNNTEDYKYRCLSQLQKPKKSDELHWQLYPFSVTLELIPTRPEQSLLVCELVSALNTLEKLSLSLFIIIFLFLI